MNISWPSVTQFVLGNWNCDVCVTINECAARRATKHDDLGKLAILETQSDVETSAWFVSLASDENFDEARKIWYQSIASLSLP